jgi:glycosyltransferase involved in cell wall biosynthesis
LSKAITFVIAVNSRKVFEENFLASPCLKQLQGYQVLLQEGFDSATKAYNVAIEHATNDLLIFCHQDIILPEGWNFQLQNALDSLAVSDPDWGVLGVYGKTQDGGGWGHVYSSGRDVIGEPLKKPVRIQTLDEIVLIFRKSSGLRFDDHLPHFHLYGTDICLQAAKLGLKSYAISAFCIHNTHQPLVLPAEFYDCCKYVKKVWKNELPIQTTCIRLTRLNLSVYVRRLRELHLRYIRRKKIGGTRTKNSQKLLEELSSVAQKS